MAEETTTDVSGVERATDGTITDQSPKAGDQSSTSTTQETGKEPAQKTDADGKTLLTEKGAEPVDKTEDKKSDAKGPPEKYSDYTVPDGFVLDPAIKTEADTLFKGLGLSQEAAQSLVDFYTAKTTEAATAPYKAYQEMTDGWRKDAENHPDLKGKIGPGKEISIRIAKALDGIGDAQLASDFRAQMDLTGAGNHQAFIRVLDYFAQRMTEGTHVAGKGPSELGQSKTGDVSKPSAAAAMWPTLPSASR